MTPAEQAADVYNREFCVRTFNDDLKAHLLHGYVYSTPEFFVMGRPVMSTAPGHDVVNPWVNWHESDCDAWLVYLMAGDIRKALTMLPYPLPLIGFERKNILRFYPLRRFQEFTLASIKNGG